MFGGNADAKVMPLAPSSPWRKKRGDWIALHVFGRNTGAQALYAKLGFRPTNIHLFKTIEAEGERPC